MAYICASFSEFEVEIAKFTRNQLGYLIYGVLKNYMEEEIFAIFANDFEHDEESKNSNYGK